MGKYYFKVTKKNEYIDGHQAVCIYEIKGEDFLASVAWYGNGGYDMPIIQSGRKGIGYFQSISLLANELFNKREKHVDLRMLNTGESISFTLE